MIRKVCFFGPKKMRFMQTESVLQNKNRSEPAKNRFSLALLWVVAFLSLDSSVTYIKRKSASILPIDGIPSVSPELLVDPTTVFRPSVTHIMTSSTSILPTDGIPSVSPELLVDPTTVLRPSVTYIKSNSACILPTDGIPSVGPELW